jgi:hypothetical protein
MECTSTVCRDPRCRCQGSADTTVKHHPKHCQASAEGQTSSIRRSHTDAGWGRSGLNRRPTDYESSQSRRSQAFWAGFVLSWWWFSDAVQGSFSNWCATSAPQDFGAVSGLWWPFRPPSRHLGGPLRPGDLGALVTMCRLATTRVCALTSSWIRWVPTGCDAGTQAGPTGVRAGAVGEVTAGAYGSQARAGPCRHQRSRR